MLASHDTSTRLQIGSSSMWGRMILGKSNQNSLRRISVSSLRHFKNLKFSRSSVDHFRLLGLSTRLQRTCSIKGVKFINNFNLFWGHRQLFKLDGLHPNKLGARVLKDNIYFFLRHPSVVCANPLGLNGTRTPGQSMSGQRTSYQLQSHHVAGTSHKDTDNTTQPKQPLLMDILAEPSLQSSSHADCDVLQPLQDCTQ